LIVALAGVAGLLFSLSAPPGHAPSAALVGLALVAALVGRAEGGTWRGQLARGAAVGWAFGAAANLGMLRFSPLVIVRFTPLPWPAAFLALVLLALLQGTAWAAAGSIAAGLARARLPRPMAFAAGAYAASFAPVVFPWTAAGVLAAWPASVQLAEHIGERGLSAVLALVCGLAAESMLARRARPALAAAAVLGGMTAWGAWRMRQLDAGESTPTARIALIQPAIDAATRWEASRAADILARLGALTRAAEGEGVDLTVWHETAYPYAIAAATRVCPTGDGALLGFGVRGPVLTGVQLTLGHGEAWNAAAICNAGTLSEPYAKRHLLAFGEAVPLSSSLPWLRRIFVRGTGLVPGGRAVVLRAGAIRAGVLVCFEDTLPEAGREAMEGGPNLLVNLTNDAWFAGTSEPEAHLRLARLRAVELRRDLVRAVNFGPPTWVDAAGRVRARGAADVAGHLVVTPALRTGVTLYARAGDAPFALGLAAALAALALTRRRA